MKYLLILGFLFANLAGMAKITDKMNPVNWNGYTQVRFTSNLNDVNSFSLRRMKLMMNSLPDQDKNWGFKLQTTISSNQNEKFVLQDAAIIYRHSNFEINFGQFVPQYSLERFQSDAILPLAERSDVINTLIPNGTLGVRDLGVEGGYSVPDKAVEAWLGIFNGNGIKNYVLTNRGIMLTQKTAFHLFRKNLTAGYSLMYRKADQLQLTNILPSANLFSGNDYRYNLFLLYHLKNLQLQAEYLWAKLNKETADGYYLMATFNLHKNQFVASWNKYNDLIENTDDSPTAHLGYDYLFDQNKLKIMFDNGIQVHQGNLRNYTAVIQLQLFFN